MKTKHLINNTFLIIILILLSTIIIAINSTTLSLKIISALLIMLSLWLLFKSRKNPPLFLIFFFIAYCNYSISIAEYFVKGSLSVPFIEVKNLEIYGLSVKILVIFLLILAIHYKDEKTSTNNLSIETKESPIVYYSLIISLILILIFGINRDVNYAYTVSITPIYEYSSILFLFVYYFSGASLFKRNLAIMLIILFILQDFYYGGRITSLQLICLLLVTFLNKYLTTSLVIYGGIFGIFVNTFVNAYRQLYDISSLRVLEIIKDFSQMYFVFDTPVYAYYSSATQIASKKYSDFEEEFKSFISFIGSIFGGESIGLGNLTTYVSKEYFTNIGGGLFPTYFYFWLGWLGVIISAYMLVVILNKITTNNKNDFQKLISITIIFSVPRWYLYTPLSLFRPILIMSLIYICLYLFNQTIKNFKK